MSHPTHCNQGEYVGPCKYRDDDCPELLNRNSANMEKFPDDVKIAAREAFLRYASFPEHDAASMAIEYVRMGNSDDMPMLRLAALAIMTEREACAKIADDKAAQYENPSENDWVCSRPIAVRLRGVSQAIRRR